MVTRYRFGTQCVPNSNDPPTVPMQPQPSSRGTKPGLRSGFGASHGVYHCPGASPRSAPQGTWSLVQCSNSEKAIIHPMRSVSALSLLSTHEGPAGMNLVPRPFFKPVFYMPPYMRDFPHIYQMCGFHQFCEVQVYGKGIEVYSRFP